MTLDTIDRAFVARWQSRQATDASSRQQPHGPPPSAPLAAACPTVSLELDQTVTGNALAGVDEMVRDDAPVHDRVDTSDRISVDQRLVERLLAAGREQWAALADEVETARLAGHRAIGIAGGERGEGRTTLVACLAQTLRDRGREVVVLVAGMAAMGPRGVPIDGGRLHDRRIVLIDGGIWFPAGPIRRQRLLMASLGCDAAILVRRADRTAAPAWAAALSATGIAVLGEVVTFAAGGSSLPGDGR